MNQDEIIEFTASLPGVAVVTASQENGAPEVAWGDTFFYYDHNRDVEPDRRFPFATIVTKDYPGFDESSQLDRPDTFRLNISVDRHRFQELIGYPPSQHRDRRDDVDYAALDTVFPHPEYGQQAWVSIVNPGERTSSLAKELLVEAHDRVVSRHHQRR
jgi:Family of unknown function (DUF6194)